MGAMCLLNMLQSQVGENIERKQPKTGNNELMYVNIKLNGRTTHAIVDINITHNFIGD